MRPFGVFCRSSPSPLDHVAKRLPGEDVSTTRCGRRSSWWPPVRPKRVAAGIRGSRSGFAGDAASLTDAMPLDDFAVARNDVAGLADHDFARLQVLRRTRAP